LKASDQQCSTIFHVKDWEEEEEEERGGGKKRWIGDYYTGRMYGWFRCSDCDKNWESSNVYMKKAVGLKLIIF
jgi:hypothetical protein